MLHFWRRSVIPPQDLAKKSFDTRGATTCRDDINTAEVGDCLDLFYGVFTKMTTLIKYAKYLTILLSLAVAGIKLWAAVLVLLPLLGPVA